MKRRTLKVIIITAICFFVVTVWLYRMEEMEGYQRTANVVQKPVRVVTKMVQKGPVYHRIEAEGRAEAVRKSYLQFEESGKVVLLGRDENGNPLKEGSRVFGPKKNDDVEFRTGQLLARIDSRDKRSDVSQSEALYMAAQKELGMLRATLHQAEADLKEASHDHKRKLQLFEQKFIAEGDYDRSKFRYTKAVSAVSIAKLNIGSARARLNRVAAELKKVSRSPERLELRAPFDGIIARVNIKEGDYFTPSDLMRSNVAALSATAPMTIIDPSEMEVTLFIPEAEGRLVKVGQQVEVTSVFESWPKGMTFETAPKSYGEVYSVSPQIDSKRRAIRVKVRLTQELSTILDGMYTSCWIIVEAKDNKLRIPLSALLYDGSQPYVFVDDGGIARKQIISLGIKNTKYVEVLSGLNQGTLVICQGRKKLLTGSAVESITLSIPSSSFLSFPKKSPSGN
ncbi:MAG: efflux RND transporter periplasmic adaptor subunit [Desulfovibrio sp.]